MKFKILKRLNIKLSNGSSHILLFCHKPILQYDIINNKLTKIYFPWTNKKYTVDTSKPVIYLKANVWNLQAERCIQCWIDVVNILNFDFFIVCDRTEIRHNILRNITFKNTNIKFLTSKNDKLKSIVSKAADSFWTNAAYAHLSLFDHAKKNNIKRFWNIDADDTMFIIPPEEVAKIIQSAQKKADANDIKAFSLDMWYSLSIKDAWSFGITYINAELDWFKIFNDVEHDWRKNYNEKFVYNVDGFFTYLKDFKNIKIASWYVEKIYFVHWGLLFNKRDFMRFTVCKWEDNKIIYPLIFDFYKMSQFIPIASDCIKLDCNINQDLSEDFMKKMFL